MSNNKHSLNPNFKHSQTILASRPVVVVVHKILNPNFPQINIFCHKCFCQHFILDQMIKCIPKNDLIKAFNAVNIEFSLSNCIYTWFSWYIISISFLLNNSYPCSYHSYSCSHTCCMNYLTIHDMKVKFSDNKTSKFGEINIKKSI